MFINLKLKLPALNQNLTPGGLCIRKGGMLVGNFELNP